MQLSPRVYLHLSDEVRPPATSGYGQMVWVLSRALCHYKCVDLSAVPERSRVAALQLQLSQLSPFPHTAHHAVWREGVAMLWYWDAARVASAMQAVGVAPQRCRILPDSALYPPAAQGLRLLAGLAGYEGQFWRDGCLLGSRWWDALPDAAEWLGFQRGLGLDGEQRVLAVPAATRPTLQPEQALASSARAGSVAWRDERVLYFLLLALLTAPTAWFAASWLKAELAVRAISADKLQLEASAQPLLAAREQAERIASRLRELDALTPQTSQSELMRRVAAALPKQSIYLKEWDFHDTQLKLVLVLQNNAVSSSEMVGALQKVDGLVNVQVAPSLDAKIMILNMQLDTRAPAHDA